MESFFRTGGCHCRAIRYRVTSPARETYHCHCSICRQIHGTLFASFAIVPPGDFVVTEGADRLTRYDSSPGVQRYFCRRCGGHIYSDVEKLPDIRFYTVGTLDGGAHPGHDAGHERHICVASKVPWWLITDNLPQSPET
ncbi:MAG: GFA family protein [Dongiaceae bacterium]